MSFLAKNAILLTLSFMSSTVLATNIEHLFYGFEHGCQHTMLFKKYLENVCLYIPNKKTLEECKIGKVFLPKEFKIQSVRTKNEDEYSSIKLKFKTNSVTWNGLKIVGIETWHGRSNGIAAQSLILNVPSIKEAKEIAIKNGVIFEKLPSEVREYLGSEFIWHNDEVRLVCDESD